MPAKAATAANRWPHYISVAVLLLAIAAIGIALLACIGSLAFAIYRGSQRAAEGQPATAIDGSCQVHLPPGWITVPVQPGGVLAADGLSGRATFDAFRSAKQDLAPGETYRTQARQYVDALLANPQYENPRLTKGPVDCVVNGRPAVEYEMEGIFIQQRTRFVFLIRVIDGERSIFKVAVNLPPSEAAQHRPTAEKLLGSFKELR
jgi:hypothetical protein